MTMSDATICSALLWGATFYGVLSIAGYLWDSRHSLRHRIRRHTEAPRRETWAIIGTSAAIGNRAIIGKDAWVDERGHDDEGGHD